MLSISHPTRVYLATQPVDMRKQFDGLWALAEQVLGEDPFSGALFLFTNKGRNRLKILYWDGTGVWVFAKRLEEGRLSWPTGSQAGKVSLTPEAFQLLLCGVDCKRPVICPYCEAG